MDAKITIKLEQFAQGLRWALREDGDPSYRELRRRTSYSISTISRMLSGKYFPKWDFTRQFLRACHIPDEQINGRWHARWLEIAELRDPLGDFPYQADDEDTPEAAAPPPASTECTECGALITNQFRHQAWHMQYVRRPATTRDRHPLTAAIPDPGRALHRLSS